MGKRSCLFYDEMDTPIGPITILVSDKGLCRVDFGSSKDLSSMHQTWSKRFFLSPEFKKDIERTEKVLQQIDEYFNGQRREFSLDYQFHGTPFQQRVWRELIAGTSFGKTMSYKDIAQQIQAPKAVRAVGGAINKNPLSIVVPCHRIIGSNGSLVGYNGGMERKKYLLHLESAPVTF